MKGCRKNHSQCNFLCIYHVPAAVLIAFPGPSPSSLDVTLQGIDKWDPHFTVDDMRHREGKKPDQGHPVGGEWRIWDLNVYGMAVKPEWGEEKWAEPEAP